MNAKHTAGQWTAERMRLTPRDKDRRCGFVVNGPDITDDLPTRICDLRVPQGITGFSEGEANARLIAAAPDLLDALIELESRFEALRELAGFSPASIAAEKARMAIAKARGE